MQDSVARRRNLKWKIVSQSYFLGKIAYSTNTHMDIISKMLRLV